MTVMRQKTKTGLHIQVWTRDF